MSRNFQSGQFVNHGTAAGLDDLAAASFTVWAWVFRGDNGSNQEVVTKDGNNGGTACGWNLVLDNSLAEGQIRFVVFRVTTVTDFTSNASNVVALYTPTFVAATFNDAASPKVTLIRGTASAAAAEVSGYSVSDAGTGALISDAPASLYVGNIQRADTNPFGGQVQMGGIIRGSVLTAAQLETIRAATRTAVDTDVTLSNARALFTHELVWHYKDGNVSDRTANAHNGTVTGARSAPDFPITAGGSSLVGPGGLAG